MFWVEKKIAVFTFAHRKWFFSRTPCIYPSFFWCYLFSYCCMIFYMMRLLFTHIQCGEWNKKKRTTKNRSKITKFTELNKFVYVRCLSFNDAPTYFSIRIVFCCYCWFLFYFSELFFIFIFAVRHVSRANSCLFHVCVCAIYIQCWCLVDVTNFYRLKDSGAKKTSTNANLRNVFQTIHIYTQRKSKRYTTAKNYTKWMGFVFFLFFCSSIFGYMWCVFISMWHRFTILRYMWVWLPCQHSTA